MGKMKKFYPEDLTRKIWPTLSRFFTEHPQLILSTTAQHQESLSWTVKCINFQQSYQVKIIFFFKPYYGSFLEKLFYVVNHYTKLRNL